MVINCFGEIYPRLFEAYPTRPPMWICTIVISHGAHMIVSTDIKTVALKDVASDPTLPHTKAVPCALGHGEAVFFQSRLKAVADLRTDAKSGEREGITINSNAWSGHPVNEIYDTHYMMGRVDVAIGVGGKGGILEDDTIQQYVIKYHLVL
ncbi:hypothetical protein Tco_0616271 [Tanacetum coccineum]